MKRSVSIFNNVTTKPLNANNITYIYSPRYAMRFVNGKEGESILSMQRLENVVSKVVGLNRFGRNVQNGVGGLLLLLWLLH